ncbi:unnamed protein product, partial [Porites lobata]
MVVDQSSQTVFCKYTLSAKVDTMILRNEVAISKPQAPKVIYSGDIDDIQIFRDCGIMKYLEPYDVVLADRGFTVRELLNPLQVELRIPSFLKGRGSLSAAEELETRQIAKARIHVERFNERLKQFRIIGRKIPLTLAPL